MVKGTINICCDHKEYLQQAIYSNIAKANFIYKKRFYLLFTDCSDLSVSSGLHHGHDDVFSSHEGQLMTDMPLDHL